MPVYEYVCRACGRRARLAMTYAEYDRATPLCPHCGSAELKRRIGRVAVARSEATRLDALMDERALAGLDDDDPRAMGQMMRHMSDELGEDMGQEFEEVVGRLESGESPAAIEAAIPDLGE